jgi:adenylate kinase
LDDETGEHLTPQSSDAEEKLTSRLQDYRREVKPVLSHYEPTGCVIPVDANLDLDSVWQCISAIVSEKRRVVVLLGPPCSGKRTIVPHILNKCGGLAITCKDLLAPMSWMDWDDGLVNGASWATDDDAVETLRQRIAQPDCAAGFLLVDFPRTVAQALRLDTMLASKKEKVQTVFALAVPETTLVDRALGRWVHRASGRSYHSTSRKPKSVRSFIAASSIDNWLDDLTNEPLEQQSHDTVDGVQKRLQGYNEKIRGVMEHYKASACLKLVDASGSVENVWKSIRASL